MGKTSNESIRLTNKTLKRRNKVLAKEKIHLMAKVKKIEGKTITKKEILKKWDTTLTKKRKKTIKKKTIKKKKKSTKKKK